MDPRRLCLGDADTCYSTVGDRMCFIPTCIAHPHGRLARGEVIHVYRLLTVLVGKVTEVDVFDIGIQLRRTARVSCVVV